MVTLHDIIIEPNEDNEYNFNHGYINIPLKIFGQIRFEDDDEKLGVCIDKKVKPEEILEKLNDYLSWLEGCQNILEEYYLEENRDMLDEWYDGELDPEWYETLEMYSGTLDINKDGTFGATFSCGDNMNTDHLLMIEIDNKQIKEMWFDG